MLGFIGLAHIGLGVWGVKVLDMDLYLFPVS